LSNYTPLVSVTLVKSQPYCFAMKNRCSTPAHSIFLRAQIFGLSLLLSLISSPYGFAQNNQQLIGKVLDAKTLRPIEFAHVSIKSLGIGVVSNEVGAFSLNYPEKLANDTLSISFLGYSTRYIRLKQHAERKAGDTLKILLSPDALSLQEVIISPNSDSAKAVIKRALSLLKKNYATRVYQMNAFFREKVQNRDDYKYTRLIEGMLDIQDWGIKSHPDKIRIRLNEFRKSEDMARRNLAGYTYHKIFGEQNDFYDILEHDPIRIHFFNRLGEYSSLYRYWLGEFLSDKMATARIIKLTSYDGELVFHIKFSYRRREFEGDIYINARDYGIHHLELLNTMNNSISQVHEKLLEDFKDFRDNAQFEGKYCYKLTLSYQKFQGKYYLSFLQNTGLGDFRKSNVKPGKKTVSYNTTTLMVNSIVTDKKEMDKVKYRHTISREENINKLKKPYNANFWKNYNILLASPIESKVIQDLSFDTNLEEQFKKN
jgi:CarboxypepD_reg-like domain